MSKKYLMTPGPTPVPEDIRLEMAKPMIHHRTKEYQAIFKDATEGLRKIFKTANDVYTFTSSGTGAMEASIVNVLSPGDKIIVVRGGKFGERFADIAKAYGVETINIDVEWGNAPKPEVIAEALKNNTGIKGVYTTLCETSTATVFDIKSIARSLEDRCIVCRHDKRSRRRRSGDAWGVDIRYAARKRPLDRGSLSVRSVRKP